MAEEEQQEESVKTEPNKNSNLFIIIGAFTLILFVIIGGVLTAFILGGEEESIIEESPQAKTKLKRRNTNTRGLVVGPMYPLEVFTVNLLSDSGRKFLKTQVNLELDDNSLSSELDSKAPVIRDLVILILTSKTLEEVSTAKGKEKLKEQLVNQINLRLQDGQINNIYFTEFVIQ